MITPHDHRDPPDDEKLSAEERDLAARLGRIGPFDGPSPAMDAKILAAAHAAAASRSSGRRRLAWLGVPPAVVTGTGVAAAAVLALGLVWQLRPQPGLVESHSEADAGEEVILIAEPAGTAAAPRANPPPFPGDTPEVAAGGRAQDVAPAAAASRDAAKAVAAPASPRATEERAAQASMADEAAQAAVAAAQKREAEAAARAASESGFVAEPPAGAEPAHRSHATYTSAARARPEQRMRAATNAAPPAPAPAAAPPAEQPASAAASAEAPTLDRIEVTGSRIGAVEAIDWSQVPISEDSHLAAAEWLERIRARRDGDDEDNARASLRLFEREYPRVRLPDDLRELLADAKQ
jgi:hypothetical protein